MPRIIKASEVRRSEILEAAQRLVFTRGYEDMTVQDILDALHISKGAFYHYFDSKQALLEALIDRMIDEIMEVLAPVVQDPHLRAPEKLQRYFDAGARWKTAKKSLMLGLLRIWSADENAIVREKQRVTTIKRIAPMIMEIVQQGIREGAFSSAFPDQASEMVLSLMQGLGDAIVAVFLSPASDERQLERTRELGAAYTDAIERVLGAPAGSLHLIDSDVLKSWFSEVSKRPAAPSRGIRPRPSVAQNKERVL